MTESEKINGWTFEETVKTAKNLMESEQNMFKWDVLRHLRDFGELSGRTGTVPFAWNARRMPGGGGEADSKENQTAAMDVHQMQLRS